MTPIEGEVATLLGTWQVAINRGTEQGVTVGQTFRVFAPALEIRDPVSQQSLGAWSRPKGHCLRVQSVAPRYAVCGYSRLVYGPAVAVGDPVVQEIEGPAAIASAPPDDVPGPLLRWARALGIE